MYCNYCCCLPVEGNGYQREHTGCHGDVGDEIVDSAVEATKRPVTEQYRKEKVVTHTHMSFRNIISSNQYIGTTAP